MRQIFLLIVSIFSLFASDNEDFLKTLNEVSEIATKTKLNIDKTPSNVEVIRRDFILKSGAKTLLDILQYLPGVEISMSSSGKKELIIRGNKSVYRDKIKFMINGVEVTNNLYSNQFYYYNFPAILIKRIEFTKTPDSVLYGANAFVGVINIITVDAFDNNLIDFYASNKNGYLGAFFKKFNNDSFLIDGYYSYSNPDIKAPTSYLIDIQTFTSFPYRSGVEADVLEKNFGIGLRYQKENDKLEYRLQFYEKGNFFGIANLPPLKKDKRIKLIHQYVNFRHSFYLRYNLKDTFDAGMKYYEWNGEFRLFPYDFNETIDNNPDNDIISGAKIHEIEYFVKNLVHYNEGIHNFICLLGFKYAKPFDFYYIQYVPSMQDNQNLFNLGPNREHLTGKLNVLKEGIYRRVFSTALEDLVVFNDNFSSIAGIRYDYYSDFGSKISYKIGSVYNNDFYTFKLLFNNAYRIPSWVELYAKSAADFNGNENLKPETINMLEAIAVKKFTKKDRLKFVFFYGKNSNYIDRVIDLTTGKKIYENLGNYYIRGAEISYSKKDKKYNFNISYSLTKNYYDFSNEIAGIDIYSWSGNRERLIKSYLSYNVTENKSFFIGAIYGSRIKTPFVEDVSPYFTLNTNFKFKIGDIYITIGGENITNHKNYYWVSPGNLIFRRYFFEYKDARVPAHERKIFLNLYKEW